MTTPSIPLRGIRVQAAMKWLLDTLINGKTLPIPFGYQGAGADHFGGGSVNMKLGYSAAGYIGDAEHGRQRLLNYYQAEALEGHGGGEILTPSHRQLHEGFHAAIALYALRIGDTEMAELALGWLRVEYLLLTACLAEIEDKGKRRQEPWTAGARAVQKGKLRGDNKASGAFLRAVDSGEVPEKTDQYFLAALCVAAMPARVRRRITGPMAHKDWPTVQGELTIKRWANGDFTCLFWSLPTKGGGARAAGSLGGETWIEREGPPDGMLDRYPREPPVLVIRPKVAAAKTKDRKQKRPPE